MAILGARMLEPQKKGVETAEAASIHRKGEESMLSSVAQAISLAVEKALKWFAEWAGANPEEVEFDLNRDFYPVPMTPEELTALIAAWQAGAISDQTLFDNLQQGEIIDNDTTLEDEQARIANQAPRLQGQPEDGSAPSSLPEPQSHSIHVHLPQRSGNKTVTTPSGATYKVQASD